MTDSC